MKIEVLGTGCRKCKKLHQMVLNAVEKLHIKAEVVKVESLDEILAYGVAFTPGLVIDGEVKLVGKLPKSQELEALIG